MAPHSFDRERSIGGAGFFFVYEDRIDARASRAGPQRALHARDRFDLSLDERFHTAVRQVTHPPGHAFTECRVPREKTEPDTLYATANQEPSSHAHWEHWIIPGPAVHAAVCLGGGSLRDNA